MGTAGRTGNLTVVGERVDRESDDEGNADDGVVGCVESTSEGACEVAGVSKSDGPAMVDACDSACSCVI